MRNDAYRILATLLVAGLCLSSLAAQPQESAPAQFAGQSPVLRSSSELVRIDVEVTDRSGKPVKGLRADQFIATDDGHAQKVSIFSYEDIEAVETASEESAKPIVVAVDSPVAVAIQSSADQVRDRRMLVLFFDLTSMATDDLMRAHDAAAKFVKQQMASRDTLATLSTDTGGRAFFDLGDLSDAFPRIEQDNTGYYLVGYDPGANIKHDGSWHAVHVKVNAPGVRVRYRSTDNTKRRSISPRK